MDWREKYRDKIVSLSEAVKHVRCGDSVHSTLFASIPYNMLNELAKRREELFGVKLYVGAASETYELLKPEYEGHIDVVCAFLGQAERQYMHPGSSHISFQVVQLSKLVEDRNTLHRPDVIMTAASYPDSNGMISLGLVPIDADICRSAREVLIQFDRNVPYISNPDSMLHMDEITCCAESTGEERPYPAKPPNAAQLKIAGNIADRIPDGACIQLGIGGICDTVGYMCKSKKNLGIHTEFFTESMVDLMSCGAVDNSRKNIDKGISIFGLAFGSSKVNRFTDHNPHCMTRSLKYANDPNIIGKNDNMYSINSTLQVDLTGQAASEGIGHNMYSGIGGQLDYVRGSQLSRGGHSFLVMESTWSDAEGRKHSKVLTSHSPGTPVTTPRSEVEFVATEYGIVDLKYETIENRARKLISIAHPDFRDQLTFDAKRAGLII